MEEVKIDTQRNILISFVCKRLMFQDVQFSHLMDFCLSSPEMKITKENMMESDLERLCAYEAKVEAQRHEAGAPAGARGYCAEAQRRSTGGEAVPPP